MSFFDVQDRINRKIYSLFNIASDAVFYLKRDIRNCVGKNSAYHDIHAGDRCFILGTGPSLNLLSESDIRFLSNEITFGVNSLFKFDRLDEIYPRYYLLMDNNYWGISKDTFSELREKYKSKQPVFITDYRAKNLLIDSDERIILYSKNYPLKYARFDVSKNISIAMNVVGFAILSAMYMGFKEIYLLGCDYNSFCSLPKSHCYDDSSEKSDLPKYNLAFYLKYYAITTELHYTIQNTAKMNKINIINLTENSLLDAYPKMGIENIIN